MTNLESIFKSRDITLPTKVHLVKGMVFPVVMYGCESRIRVKSQESLHLCRQSGVRTDTGTKATASLGSEYRQSHENQGIQLHESKTMSCQLLGMAERRSWTLVSLCCWALLARFSQLPSSQDLLFLMWLLLTPLFQAGVESGTQSTLLFSP